MKPVQQPCAFWITGKCCAELQPATLPECQPHQVLVRTLYSAISRGTEMLVFNNQIPEQEQQRMQAPFQEGNFPYPVKYGYINVGIVEQGPASIQGQTVFCLYPHQTHYVVAIDAVTPLPEKIPAARAVLAANMETAVNALWDSEVSIGDRISVVGAGAVGSLVAYLASKIVGCNVELIDINPGRKNIAESLGAQFATPDTASKNRDLVFHASATANGLNTALALAGMEARVIEMSWFGTQSVAIDLGKSFHSQRLQLRSTQVGEIPPQQQRRWSYRRRLELALSLLDDTALDCLISSESDFNDLPATMQTLAVDSADTLCHRIRYH